mgnify:CR=1 FL=1|jgi:hypothetical protein
MPDPFGMPPNQSDAQKGKRKKLDDNKLVKMPSIKGSQTPGPKGKTQDLAI